MQPKAAGVLGENRAHAPPAPRRRKFAALLVIAGEGRFDPPAARDNLSDLRTRHVGADFQFPRDGAAASRRSQREEEFDACVVAGAAFLLALVRAARAAAGFGLNFRVCGCFGFHFHVLIIRPFARCRTVQNPLVKTTALRINRIFLLHRPQPNSRRLNRRGAILFRHRPRAFSNGFSPACVAAILGDALHA
jgi:hypothetical protein